LVVAFTAANDQAIFRATFPVNSGHKVQSNPGVSREIFIDALATAACIGRLHVLLDFLLDLTLHHAKLSSAGTGDTRNTE
jgi:hypothetical protein